MLYLFAGLPGTGKTTLARQLARDLGAVFLRIDTIEQALRETSGPLRGPEGYVVAYRVASDNLRLGRAVVADSVNPIQLTRAAWRDVARHAGVAFAEIEIVCSNLAQHRARFESRSSNETFGITWADVLAREYEPWDTRPLVIDTAGQTESMSYAALKQALGGF